MLSLALPGRIFVYTRPTDMRKSFDGLAALVREHLGADPLSGHLFIFTNAAANRLKVLYWSRHGCACVASDSNVGGTTFPPPPTARSNSPRPSSP